MPHAKDSLNIIQVTIIVPLVPFVLANFVMVINQLTLEEEETSVSRGPAVEAQELLLLPDPFFTRRLAETFSGASAIVHAVELHGLEEPAPPVKELGHIPLPLMPPVNFNHHLL
jgi:hypothetical protein